MDTPTLQGVIGKALTEHEELKNAFSESALRTVAAEWVDGLLTEAAGENAMAIANKMREEAEK